MKSRTDPYPDISDILARKARGRRQLAARSFGEKLDMLDALREQTAPLRRAREQSRGGWRAVAEASAAYAAAPRLSRRPRKK